VARLNTNLFITGKQGNPMAEGRDTKIIMFEPKENRMSLLNGHLDNGIYKIVGWEDESENCKLYLIGSQRTFEVAISPETMEFRAAAISRNIKKDSGIEIKKTGEFWFSGPPIWKGQVLYLYESSGRATKVIAYDIQTNTYSAIFDTEGDVHQKDTS
jgi:hypothetical protein